MEKILGIDLGSNSVGISVRDIDKGNTVVEQLEYFSSVIFEAGVKKGATGENFYASKKRREYRGQRNLYKVRRFRLWATLRLLIEQGFCPLSLDDLDKWSKFDKNKDLRRRYPIGADAFERWIRLDFDGDGQADYSSPYHLRSELINRQFDFSEETERYKLGRALYHIARRRGFKSSKGETVKEENKEIYDSEGYDLKKSEIKKCENLEVYMRNHGFKTVGSAFYGLEREGVRIRGNVDFQAVRSLYEDEITAIFEYQKGLNDKGEFLRRLLSRKKGEGTIFYKKRLMSQKGSVGKCTLEPNKERCPISHPDFEIYRAWCFINNIKFRLSESADFENLGLDLKHKLFNEVFLRIRTSFKFSEIENFIKKEESCSFVEFNYKSNTNVSGCPICGRLKVFLGAEWQTKILITETERINVKTGEVRYKKYDYKDIWHICFSLEDSDDVDVIKKVVKNLKDLKISEDEAVKKIISIANSIQQGYANVSLKAINNINRFLQKGLSYSNSVLLAKLPDLLGNKQWEENESLIMGHIDKLIWKNKIDKLVVRITNVLIANYKVLPIEQQFAYKDYKYELDESDRRDVKEATLTFLGEKLYKQMSSSVDMDELQKRIECLYQSFFYDLKRDYLREPKLSEEFKRFISSNFSALHCENGFYVDGLPCKCHACKKLEKLYHPSQIEFYSPAKEVRFEQEGVLVSKKLLESPVIGAMKNPVVLRALHILRKQINSLLKAGIIDEDTRVVVEFARDLNDLNKRSAIEEYQRLREAENKEMLKCIEELKNVKWRDGDIDKARLFFEQQTETKGYSEDSVTGKSERMFYGEVKKREIEKYKLWREQKGLCIYTGKIISISDLFDNNKIDIEHTLPRSVSFDNSLANLTVCYSSFNREVKKNKFPSELENYEEIKTRIRSWIDKVESLKKQVERWSFAVKTATDKDMKDSAIRQKYLWQMDLDYWSNKVGRFLQSRETLNLGFKNSQLVDTRIISKYSYHFLRTVFKKVEVQKGSVTSDFRKMLGVQSVVDKKDRSKHSHHAIDATILTLIPSASKRDKMLELYYKNLESMGADLTLKKELDNMLKSCRISKIEELNTFIEDNIFVNHITKDNALVPSRKKVRVRGNVITIKDAEGNVLKEFDKRGNETPKVMFKYGDCIRGELHGKTFYGAIRKPIRDESGRVKRTEDGGFLLGDKIFVKRCALVYKKSSRDEGFKRWEDLEDVIVDKALFKMMKSQYEEGTSFEQACKTGFYMQNKYGEKINKIRHVRCEQKNVTNPLEIKKHIYESSNEHKRCYYAAVGDLYVMCKYEKEVVVYSLFQISQNKKYGLGYIPKTIKGRKGNVLQLSQVIKKGDLVLLYKDSEDELRGADKKLLSQRLYVVVGFETDKRITMVRHIVVKQSDSKGSSIKDFNKLPDVVRCSVNQVKFLQQGKEFELKNGEIEFL